MTQNLRRMLRTYRRGDLLVTPEVERYLISNPGGIQPTQQTLDRLVETLSTEPRRRDGSWAASARGQCERAQLFTHIGITKDYFLDPRRQNLFNDGMWRHLRWQIMLLEIGLLKDIEVPVRLPSFNLVGTMDGEGHDPWGFELKGIWSLSAIKDGPMPSHLLQIHSYFLARPDMERVALVYEDKRTQDWKEFVIERDPKLMAQVRKELLKLNRHLSNQTLPEVLDECRTRQGFIFQGCPFKTRCLDITSWEEAVTEQRNSHLPFERGVADIGLDEE